MVYHTVDCSLMIFNWCFICQKQFFQISQIITHGARANTCWLDQEKGHKKCFAFFLLVNGYMYCAMMRVGLVFFFSWPDVFPRLFNFLGGVISCLECDASRGRSLYLSRLVLIHHYVAEIFSNGSKHKIIN